MPAPADAEGGDLSVPAIPTGLLPAAVSQPSFTLLPIGTGGGPLETDLSAYLVKPASSDWGHGCVSLEAGSGIGALAELLGKAQGRALWKQFGLDEGETPGGDRGEAWQAGRVMQTVRAYLVTHAHLDHVLSLILGSGGLPPPQSPASASDEPPWSSTRVVFGSLETLLNLQSAFEERIWPDIGGFERGEQRTKIVRFLEIAPPPPPAPSTNLTAPSTVFVNGSSSPSGRTLRPRQPTSSISPATVSVSQPSLYATLPPLEPLLPPAAYKQTQAPALAPSVSSSLLPVHVQNQIYTPLPTSPPLSVLAFPISHGTCSAARRRGSLVDSCCGAFASDGSDGAKSTKRKRSAQAPGEDPAEAVATASDIVSPLTTYEASAFFVRLDDGDLDRPGETRRREFCFFGDVEPDSISLNPRNRRVWEEVACRFQAGILDSVFIECSYDNSRPDHLLYGHLSPRHVLAELAVLFSLLEPPLGRSTNAAGASANSFPTGPSSRLRGLKVFIIHVKETLESLASDHGGIRERVWRELEEGKKTFEGGILGEIDFKLVKKGEALVF